MTPSLSLCHISNKFYSHWLEKVGIVCSLNVVHAFRKTLRLRIIRKIFIRSRESKGIIFFYKVKGYCNRFDWSDIIIDFYGNPRFFFPILGHKDPDTAFQLTFECCVVERLPKIRSGEWACQCRRLKIIFIHFFIEKCYL